MIVVEVRLKTFNPELLTEQLGAALPGRVGGILWGGFDLVGIRYQPAAETRVIGRVDGPLGVTTDTAEPGEVRFRVPDDWSAAEGVTLDGVLDAHDGAALTAEQQRRALDLARLQEIRDLYDLGGAITQQDLVRLLRLCARHILREARREALS